ncbi:AAA family ATPase [Brevibacillus sp. BC25]|uniref:AAA family ATPase n=1 Tax=Brevibacillus sp. BC25 TaxID=1144308 RepID=UPI00027121D1|nr:AAA family ATPase [Brevibacillus sp. BC25]EJL26282.1 GTPase subunit of restriction endonuclease [Brevibacillus sp. BC25]
MELNEKHMRQNFINWLRQRLKANGEPYSENTIGTYASSLSTAPSKLTGIELETTNLYEITQSEKFKQLRVVIESAENYEEVNKNAGNKAFHYAMQNYEEFLTELEQGTTSIANDSTLRASTSTASRTDIDKNMILYGPPGTGKTYHAVTYAVAMIENLPLQKVKEEINTLGYDKILTKYRKYQENGQIQFTTFHQSYGYEEFIEGIKPKLDIENSDEGNPSISYEIKSGIFKQFCERALAPIVQDSNEYGIRKEPTIWKVSLGRGKGNPIKKDCFDQNRIRIGWDEYGETLSEDTDYSQDGGKNIISRFIDEMIVGDIVLVLHNERTIDAIGVVTGEYEWLHDVTEYKRSRTVKWLAKNIHKDIYELNGNTVMTLGSVYRLTRITLADVMHILTELDLTPDASIQENNNRYVFIIDEINRGNISKIFGELITLIEPTKRLGQSEEIKVQLPYSPEKFGVPNNVFILGTMNTTDRSISRLDTALRRRFQFAEMLPEPEILRSIDTPGIDLCAMLTKINRRIEALFDREHTIGHAYFIPLAKDPSIERLAHIFKNAIIPLLQEYFYEDYELIRLVLGDNYKNPDEQFIQTKKLNVSELFGATDHIELDDKTSYEINEHAFFHAPSYRKIYEQ